MAWHFYDKMKTKMPIYISELLKSQKKTRNVCKVITDK